MPQFRKKPVVIEAVQWTNNGSGSLQAIEDLGCEPMFAADGTPDLIIRTLEGDMRASVGDWIIRGVKGEFYPCKPDIFAQTYEPVEQEAAEPEWAVRRLSGNGRVYLAHRCGGFVNALSLRCSGCGVEMPEGEFNRLTGLSAVSA